MALYLGNQLIGNGIYLGNNNITDANVNIGVNPINITGGITGSFVSGSITYKYHQFNSSGNLEVINPSLSTYIKILVVAGGGGGALGANGGAGGAGGGGGVNFTSNNILGIGSYTVTIGNGGTGAIRNGLSAVDGNDGFDSSFSGSGLLLTGGKGQKGISAGTGKGGDCGSPIVNTGGNNTTTGGGGGAGIGGNGTNASAGQGGNGGAGAIYNLVGADTGYGGGGGGAGGTGNTFGIATEGGGNGGNSNTANPQNGTVNTGGGGGGGNSVRVANAGSGGSGVVIVTYQI